MRTTQCLLMLLLGLFQTKINIATAKATEVLTNDLQPEEEDCVQELSLNRQQIIQLNRQDYTTDDNDNFNAFIGCVWRKLEFQNLDGEINYENLNEMVRDLVELELADESPEQRWWAKRALVEEVKKCEHYPPEKGNSYEQTAVRVLNCIKNKLIDSSAIFDQIFYRKNV